MAEVPLILKPKPDAATVKPWMTYLVVGALGAAAFVYLYAVTHKRPARVAAKAPTVTIGYVKPPELPKAPPPPEPVPAPQPVTWQPQPRPSPSPIPKSEQSALQKAREKERMEGLRAPILQAAFGHGTVHEAAPGTSAGAPQVLEIPSQYETGGDRQELAAAHRGFGQNTGLNAPQVLSAQFQPYRALGWQLNAGMQIPVMLAQDVTSDTLAPFTALITHDVYDATGQHLLIPGGASTLFGYTDLETQTNGQATLLLAAKTLYTPTGTLSLEGMPAASRLGSIGLHDQVNRHFVQRYGSALALSLVTAGVRMATYAHGSGGFAYSPEDAAMNGAGSVLGNTVGEELRHSLQIKPTVYVRAGYPFAVTVTQDIVFPHPTTHVAQGER